LWRTPDPGDTVCVQSARIAVACAVAGTLSIGSVAYAVVDLDHPGTVAELARRDVPASPDAVCDLVTIDALAGRHPEVRQFVVAQTASWTATSATVEVAVRSAEGGWRCQRAPQTARVGRAGTRPLLERVSGDDTTPAGVFPLGVVTAWDGQRFSIFGNRPDPGVRAPYRSVRSEDCWGATKHTARYQHLVNLPNCPGPADEWLPKFGDVYSHAAVIGANLDPISGDEPGETPHAAAIFLHRHSYTSGGASKATSGCVSLAEDDLIATLRLLDPRLTPHFAIGPTDYLRTTA
jgi:L,D-peptidoglycan transpeptidase YkuD (ErfK/YbiS/YcfS/YnhG family)